MVLANAPVANRESVPFAAGRDKSLVKEASHADRKGFVRKVYGILCVQLSLTFVVAASLCKASPQWLGSHIWLLYASQAVMLCALCAMCCCHDKLKTFPTNYVFLFMLTGAMSFLVGFASAMFTWQSVALAAGVTAAIFVAMTLFAVFSKTDFTGWGPYLAAALFTMIGFGLAISILNMFGVKIKMMVMFYDFMGVLLFTFYIVYDTQLIMGELGGHRIQFSLDDYVLASLNLYLDIINLFLHLLSLLGSRR